MRRPLARKKRRGSAATEFALWVFPIMTLISGMVDFSWYMSRYQNIVRVARDSARTGAAVYESPDDTPGEFTVPAANAHALASFKMMNMECVAPDCIITVSYREDPYKQLQVEIVYEFEPLIGLYKFTPNLYSRFVMLHEFQ
jgi:Flp pilus assembly protein TadG